MHSILEEQQVYYNALSRSVVILSFLNRPNKILHQHRLVTNSTHFVRLFLLKT